MNTAAKPARKTNRDHFTSATWKDCCNCGKRIFPSQRSYMAEGDAYHIGKCTAVLFSQPAEMLMGCAEDQIPF